MKVFIFHFTLFPTPLEPLSNNPSIFPLEILLVRDPSIWLTESIRIVRELYAKTIVIFVSFSSAWWPFPPNYTTNLPMSDDSQLISLILISFLNVFYVKASRDFYLFLFKITNWQCDQNSYCPLFSSNFSVAHYSWFFSVLHSWKICIYIKDSDFFFFFWEKYCSILS